MVWEGEREEGEGEGEIHSPSLEENLLWIFLWLSRTHAGESTTDKNKHTTCIYLCACDVYWDYYHIYITQKLSSDRQKTKMSMYKVHIPARRQMLTN